MTDEEIVARSLCRFYGRLEAEITSEYAMDWYGPEGGVVVAALREAGRLVPVTDLREPRS